MKIFIIICMFIVTLYAIGEIKEYSKQRIGEVEQTKREYRIDSLGCVIVAAIAIVFDAAGVLLLVFGA